MIIDYGAATSVADHRVTIGIVNGGTFTAVPSYENLAMTYQGAVPLGPPGYYQLTYVRDVTGLPSGSYIAKVEKRDVNTGVWWLEEEYPLTIP